MLSKRSWWHSRIDPKNKIEVEHNRERRRIIKSWLVFQFLRLKELVKKLINFHDSNSLSCLYKCLFLSVVEHATLKQPQPQPQPHLHRSTTIWQTGKPQWPPQLPLLGRKSSLVLALRAKSYGEDVMRIVC